MFSTKIKKYQLLQFISIFFVSLQHEKTDKNTTMVRGNIYNNNANTGNISTNNRNDNKHCKIVT